MSIETEAEGLKLCGRQSIKFVSARRIGQSVYVFGTSRDDYGEIWTIRFDDDDEHILSECIFNFSLENQPEIPLCVLNDIAELNDWMREVGTNRGLAREH